MRFLGECCKIPSTYLAQFLVTSVCSLFLVEVKFDSFSRKGKHHIHKRDQPQGNKKLLDAKKSMESERSRELACVQCSWDAVDHCDGAGPGAVNVVPFAGFQIATEEFPVNQIAGHGMSPRHVTPECAIAVVLVENVVHAIEVHRTCRHAQ